jgi:hypothetical protein
MPKFLVAIYHPVDFDPSVEDEATRRDIDALNRDMVEAGVRHFVGGLHPGKHAVSLKPRAEGEIEETPGTFLDGSSCIGGLWVLDVATLDEAREWGRKAAKACRTPVEVRQFH